MTLFLLPSSLSRVLRATSGTFFVSCFHDHAVQLCSQPDFRVSGRDLIRNTDAWIVKVISTLCVLNASKSSTDFKCLEYFSKSLNPYIVYEVVTRLGNPILGLKFFSFCQEKCEGINHLVRTYNFLVKSLCQIGFHEAASNFVFDGYFPDASVFDFLVSSCARAGKLDIARRLLVQACHSKINVNSFTYNNVLNILVGNNRVDEAVCFFKDEHLRLGFCPDACSFNIVARGLCRLGKIDTAYELFRVMGSFGCSPDVVTYNTLINGFCRAKDVDKGYDLLTQIQSRTDFSPDVVTYTSVISGYCKLGKMEKASVLLDEMINRGIGPNSFTFNVLINGFGKVGDMSSAMVMYENMLSKGCIPDVVTLTSLIDGYCRIGKIEEGINLWKEMATRNISPNAYTFSVLINALCKENRLNEARDLLRQLRWSTIVPQPFIYNPVIDGFCKAGNVDEANAILMEMEEKWCKPDKFTFTSLIIGHAMKGRMADAISLFHKMLSIGSDPDSITINAFVSCLLKAGMPSEANQIMVTFPKKDLDLPLSSCAKNCSIKNMHTPVAA